MIEHVLEPNLRLVFWELTYGCNLKCVHCRAEAGPLRSPDELSTDEAFRLIDSIKKFSSPILVLTGGEPLIRPDIFEIAKYASQSGLNVALATNGTLIDDGIASRIVESGVRRVSISLDGASAKTHDSFRGVAGCFDAAITGFNLLKKHGMSLQVNVTVTKHNLNELPLIMEVSREMGADAFHMFLLVPVGCGIQIAEEEEISPEQYEEVLRWFYRRTKTAGMELKATCAPHFFRVKAQLDKEERAKSGGDGLPAAKVSAAETGETSKMSMSAGAGHGGKHPGHGSMSGATRGCLAGSSVCFVSHKGDVYPCGYLPVKAGNVRTTDFKDIWFESPLFVSLRNLGNLKGKCGICEYKFLCEGCRARAFGTSGDFLDEEPFCIYEPVRMRGK